MSSVEIFLIGIALSMDAFAVAVCKGLAMSKINYKHTVWIALYFGIFQALMPLLGWFLGSQFAQYITKFTPWIAFLLLAIIGINMIRESLEKDDDIVDLAETAVGEEEVNQLAFKDMVILAIATSIDALAVGVTFAFLQVDIIPAVSFIGIITFVLSAVGVKIGNVFGTKYKSKGGMLNEKSRSCISFGFYADFIIRRKI